MRPLPQETEEEGLGYVLHVIGRPLHLGVDVRDAHPPADLAYRAVTLQPVPARPPLHEYTHRSEPREEVVKHCNRRNGGGVGR